MGGGMTDPVLLTQGLCKNFGALRVTNNLDLRIEAGARHALFGPNGAGKSTLVNLLTGVLKPSSGKVWLNGEEITKLPAAERVWKGLSRTFQVSTIFPRIRPACCRGAGPRRRRPGDFCSVLDCPQSRIARWVNWPMASSG
jgi:ABC-type branched-subunit amino acid transport system ATPase component